VKTQVSPKGPDLPVFPRFLAIRGGRRDFTLYMGRAAATLVEVCMPSCKALAILSIVTTLASTSQPLAHDWYPAWCCSDKDCRELVEANGETVLETPDGWKLWDGRVIPRKSAKPSPDTKFHLCEEALSKAIICFFVPPGAT
jgi:hypothetical protein